ncbi:HAD family acid phosphatase [Paractinoplanes toevensis]|uniref:Acid phosphatase n=1 Tax=Paractinoplanes toevensis TaxID=571911 RepID=A0A919TA55_9ACTN|nr:HAD family acid phosphatase [Actinoplanes toevensis]GIM91302.1 acid phosphatase [Actinoplanes toevensis]
MRDALRRGAVVVAIVTGSALPTPMANAAASLPPIETWLADVTAVTDQADAYLDDRLPDSGVKAAIVLDIDNTALESAYQGEVWPPATPSVLELTRQAQALGAAVFFVTNRPDILAPWTASNLSAAGYTWVKLYQRPTFSLDSAQTVKTNFRIKIESAGYTIVANVGNNDSDLAGGHAERTFKLPDYDGQLD